MPAAYWGVDREGLTGFELLVLVVGGVAVLVVGVVWAGAVLALVVSGEPAVVSLGQAAEALPRLSQHASEPAEAWPGALRGRLPGAVVYWACTAATAGGGAALTVVIVRWVLGPGVGTRRRWPLGVDGRARFASVVDLAPVLVRRATRGRLVVARFGRWLVATEDRAAATRSRSPRGVRRWRRLGDRGGVAFVGPQRSGKTVAVVSGVLEWSGPAVLSSVRADLLGPTLGWRSQLGEVLVFDPTSSTSTEATAARWSPVRQAGTVIGAQRAARALCDAAPREGVEGGMDFWLAQAEILLSGLLYIAHHTGRHMGAVCEWVLTQDRPSEVGTGEVRSLLDALVAHEDEAVALGVVEACRGLLGLWEMEERTVSSVYATAQTVVWPWSEPGVVASAQGGCVDLDWLLSGDNTLYLCAPIEDQKRLVPAFGGLLNDLIGQAYRRVSATGRPLDPPLLLVVDEAGNTPLRALPEYASTLGGIGVLLVTVWQSLAQIEAAYGRQADTILTNHLTKLFYAGLSDGASLRYVAQVLGDAEVETVTQSTPDRLGRGSLQWSTSRVPLAPPHALRQMRPGDALLLHATLPPAHVRTRPFYRDRELARRAATPFSARRRSVGVGRRLVDRLSLPTDEAKQAGGRGGVADGATETGRSLPAA